MTYTVFGHTVGNVRSHIVPIKIAILFLSLLCVLSACGGTTSQAPQSKMGGTLNVGLQSDAVTLDPMKSSALYDRQIMYNIYDTLVQVNAQNSIVPDLATSWTYKTPTQLIFTLHSGIKFQDGTPFNAAAVVFNINRYLNTPLSFRASELSAVKSVVAQDDLHVVFNLKKPFSPLLATLTDRAGMMLSPTAVQKLGANLANNPVNAGTGPFIFSTWLKGDHLTIKRNPNYWKKDSQGQTLPYLSSIVYKPFTNGTIEYSNLQTGAINVADSVDPNDVANAQANPSLVYKQIPALSFYGMELNTKAAPFDNLYVRQAIEWGVNRSEILTNVLKGLGVAAQGPIAPTSWAFNSQFAPYSYNVSQAKKLLAQGGHPNGISFNLIIASGSPLTTQLAQYLQSELQPAGITVNIKQETFAALLSDGTAHNFQAVLLNWSGRPDPDGNMYTYFHTGGSNNDMQFSNPQVDALLEQARVDQTLSARTADYQKAEQLIMQNAPYVFFYHGVSQEAITTAVKNFTLLPSGMMTFTNVYLGS